MCRITGRAWWGSACEVKEALEGGKWQQLLEEHKADVKVADPHTGRTLLHEVLQLACRGACRCCRISQVSSGVRGSQRSGWGGAHTGLVRAAAP